MTICDKCKQACEPEVMFVAVARQPKNEPIVFTTFIFANLASVTIERTWRGFSRRRMAKTIVPRQPLYQLDMPEYPQWRNEPRPSPTVEDYLVAFKGSYVRLPTQLVICKPRRKFVVKVTNDKT